MAVETDNPAGRLYLILRRMTLATSGGTTPILAGIFELEKDDAAGIVNDSSCFLRSPMKLSVQLRAFKE